MFTKQALQSRYEHFGEVFTKEEFQEAVDAGLINEYDGHGQFHDGFIRFEANIWNPTEEELNRAKYVLWFNK